MHPIMGMIVEGCLAKECVTMMVYRVLVIEVTVMVYCVVSVYAASPVKTTTTV